MRRFMTVATALCAMGFAHQAATQELEYENEGDWEYDDDWWDGVDEFGWGEQDYGDRYGVREWGQSEADWDYLDDYNYYQDYDPTDNRPIVDPDLGRRYEHESPETDYWYDEDPIDNLRGRGYPEEPVELGPETEEIPDQFREDRFHYDDPYIYDPNYDYDVGDSDMDRFQEWYSDEEGHQRFYDSLSL